MNIAEKTRANAAAEAREWLARFESALQAQDAAAAAALFIDSGLWRDLLAFTWNIETMAGRSAIAARLRDTAARTRPSEFPYPTTTHAATLGQPRRRRGNRMPLFVRYRFRPGQRRGAAGA